MASSSEDLSSVSLVSDTSFSFISTQDPVLATRIISLLVATLKPFQRLNSSDSSWIFIVLLGELLRILTISYKLSFLTCIGLDMIDRREIGRIYKFYYFMLHGFLSILFV